MSEPDLYDAVRHALENYDDLKILEQSALRSLQTLWPLPSNLLNESFNLPLRGVAVRYLLDKAILRLAERHSEESDILEQRYQRNQGPKQIQKDLGLSSATFHRHLNRAIDKLAIVILEMETETATLQKARLTYQLSFVPPAVRDKYVGLDNSVTTLHNFVRYRVSQPRTPVLVTGLGGIGKTSLITHALTTWIESDAPAIERILWTQVKENYNEAYTQELVIDQILGQLSRQLEISLLVLPSLEQRLQYLVAQLARYRQRFVIVVDNVESDTQHSAVLMFAHVVAHSAIVIIGSRREPSLNKTGAAVLQVQELARPYAQELITIESNHTLPEGEINQIIDVVGGHPLALLLIVAQRRRLPLRDVLDALGRSSRLSEALYNNIYSKTWDLLDDIGKGVLMSLFVLPLEGTHLTRLQQIVRTDDPSITTRQLEDAINDLMTFNLLQVTSNKDPIYSLHRLTYRFIEQQTGIAT